MICLVIENEFFALDWQNELGNIYIKILPELLKFFVASSLWICQIWNSIWSNALRLASAERSSSFRRSSSMVSKNLSRVGFPLWLVGLEQKRPIAMLQVSKLKLICFFRLKFVYFLQETIVLFHWEAHRKFRSLRKMFRFGWTLGQPLNSSRSPVSVSNRWQRKLRCLIWLKTFMRHTNCCRTIWINFCSWAINIKFLGVILILPHFSFCVWLLLCSIWINLLKGANLLKYLREIKFCPSFVSRRNFRFCQNYVQVYARLFFALAWNSFMLFVFGKQFMCKEQSYIFTLCQNYLLYVCAKINM